MMQGEQGRLIVFEGPDNVGKSTLAERLTNRLAAAGVPCEQLAFPGNRPSSLGRLVYNLHHDRSGLTFAEINATSLQMLHIAAHIDAIEEHILPAIRSGSWIVLDRFWWSTWVYGRSFGLPERSLETMIKLEQLHWGVTTPDVLFLVERRSAAPDDGNELQNGYRYLAQKQNTHTHVITLYNNASIEDALDEAWAVITAITRKLPDGRDVPTVGSTQ